nr:hypothetical protein [uncultured Acetatifactor sp.]
MKQNVLSCYLPQKAEQKSIPISLIIACCQIFHISIEKLASENFNPDQEKFIDSKNKKIQNFMEDAELDFANYLAAGIAKASDKYIVNGNDEAFNGYYQNYFGYLFPTISSEKEPLTAGIEFKKEDDICKVTVKLDIGKKTDRGDSIYKYYSGLMVIVEKTKSCYCILSRKNDRSTNELCFLSFRYIPISDINRKLDCRMVEVLTTSAGGDSSFPTAHRMFISRCDIAKEHISYVLPHLHLNQSTIMIEEQKLVQIATLSPQYRAIVKKIISLIPNLKSEQCGFLQQLDNIEAPYVSQEDADEGMSIRHMMYLLREDLVRNTARLYLSGADVQIFISQMRKYSYLTRYNKVSKKLDDNVRKMLIGLGYYLYGDNTSFN